MAKTVYLLFAYSKPVFYTTPSGKKTAFRKYYYSLRPVNDPKNSLADGGYATRQGRNKAMNKLAEEKGVSRVKILRNTTPKDYIAGRKTITKYFKK